MTNIGESDCVLSIKARDVASALRVLRPEGTRKEMGAQKVARKCKMMHYSAVFGGSHVLCCHGPDYSKVYTNMLAQSSMHGEPNIW